MVPWRRADNRGGMFRDSTPSEAPRLFYRLLPEGFALMRERWIPYGLLALACALSALAVFKKIDLLSVFASGNPLVVLRTPPINVILIAALIAIFFVLPSALRRIQPSFKMTAWRAVITLATLFCVGVATEIGYAAAVIPGIIIGVLMSQALINALLRTGERSSAESASDTNAAWSRKSRPEVVSRTPLGKRIRSCVPSSASSCLMCLVSAGCAIPILFAVRVMLPSSATCTKYWMLRSSMGSRLSKIAQR